MAPPASSLATRRAMQGNKAKNTKPELVLRRLVSELGFRYRLHLSSLPGKPDLVFAKRRKVIFVHGCFWHQHGCALSRHPKSNLNYWRQKLARNQARDEETKEKLRSQGWEQLAIWECQLVDLQAVAKQVRAYLNARHANAGDVRHRGGRRIKARSPGARLKPQP